TVVSLGVYSAVNDNGILGGTLTGTILRGTSSLTLSGVTYSAADTGLQPIATPTSGDTLGPAISSPFNVVAGAFAHLQVLMPGETAALGATSGKTGSPTPQTANTALIVTVNAVDANWNPINTNDTVHLASSDSSAVLQADTALFQGTRTF